MSSGRELCDNCLLTLSKHLEDRAKKVLEYMVKEGRSSKAEIERNTDLTTNHVNKGMLQLEYLLLARLVEVEGREKKYWFTKDGARLIELL